MQASPRAPALPAQGPGERPAGPRRASAVGPGERGAGSGGAHRQPEPRACGEGPRGSGAVTRACRSLLTRSRVGIPSHCLEDSYRPRQTALFTDICQPLSQAGAWVSLRGEGQCRKTGRHQRDRLCLHTAALGAGSHGIVCPCTGGGVGGPRSAHTVPAATFLSLLSPSLPFPLPCPPSPPPPSSSSRPSGAPPAPGLPRTAGS